jgi:formylmethanofuran dehydrogenase subunit E
MQDTMIRQCEDCERSATEQCSNCGLPFCDHHTTEWHGPVLCFPCDNQLHPRARA